MHRKVGGLVIWLWLALALAPTTAAASTEVCVVAESLDAAGDVALYPTNEPWDEPRVDYLAIRLWEGLDGWFYEAELGQAPDESDDTSVRYWWGFDVAVGDETREYWDLRIWAGNYDEADLVGPASDGNPLIGTLPVTWNGSTGRVELPRALIASHVGTNLVNITTIMASSDGVHPTTLTQGVVAATPYVQDWAERADAKACPPSDEVGTAAASTAATPGPSLVLTLGILGIAAAAMGSRKRR